MYHDNDNENDTNMIRANFLITFSSVNKRDAHFHVHFLF